MGNLEGTVRVLEEADYTRIQYQAELLGFKKMSKDMIRDNILMTCMNRQFDSAIEWGESLVWDGVERCQDLLVKYFGAEQSAYVDAASASLGTMTFGEVQKIGLAYNGSTNGAVRNGGTVSSVGTTVSAPATRLGIGSGFAGGGTFNGHIRQITYIPRRLTNAELISRST